jgi:hypothetical protein
MAYVRALAPEQLIAAFPRGEGDTLVLPRLEGLAWGNLDFLGWCDRAGDKAWLAVEAGGVVTGLALDRMVVKTSSARSFMCSICRTMHGARGIANFTYRSRRDPGYSTLTDMFCADLRCGLYVRGLLSADVSQFYETITIERKVERLREGIDRYLDAIAAFESPRKARLRLV